MSARAVGLDGPIRANPDYCLRSWGSLAPRTRARLSAVAAPADGDAVLVGRRGSMLPAKLVNASAARLFSSLRRRPRPALDALAEDQLICLILDSALQVELGSRWAGGPLAYEAMFPEAILPDPADRLGRISYDAVRWASGLPALGVGGLSGRLYGFGRLPLSRRWVRCYPHASSVLSLLDPIDLERQWRIAPAAAGRVDWLTFRRRGRRLPTAPKLLYKLYLSPHPDSLAEVLPAVPRTLAETPASVFKIGPHAAGLLRPDKLVIYLRDADELVLTARALAEVLRGARPHGVPFSAELTGEGLLSWGGDPSPGAGPLGEPAESWRLSVCRRLAESLAAAKRAPLRQLTPERYALGRLALDGVLLPSFAPSSVPTPSGLSAADAVSS
jgi:hypothetical protein